jgi:tripartite-type tricarboxylate transporter receptor subunit TctC
MFSRRHALLAVLSLIAAATPATYALAQATYPARTITIVVPYAAGGPTDVLGRTVAAKLQELLGHTVVVENRAGAGAIVGFNAVAKAAPDGYTLLLGDINLSVNPWLYKSLPYDAKRDFTPIGLIASAPLVMFVNTSSAYKSVQDLVAFAKKNPGKLSFGSAGSGNTTHLAGELLKSSYGLDIMHVPYKGAGPALNDVAGGNIDFVITGLSGGKALMDAGKLRPLAITGDKRAASLPNVPTFAQSGTPLPEMKFGSWWGLFGPAGLPPAVSATLDQALAKALAAPEVRAKLTALNIEATHGSSAMLSQWVASEMENWGAVLKKAKINPE